MCIRDSFCRVPQKRLRCEGVYPAAEDPACHIPVIGFPPKAAARFRRTVAPMLANNHRQGGIFAGGKQHAVTVKAGKNLQLKTVDRTELIPGDKIIPDTAGGNRRFGQRPSEPVSYTHLPPDGREKSCGWSQ